MIKNISTLKTVICSVLTLLTAQASLAAPVSNNTYGVGIEGFRDRYREPGLNLTDTTNYGSITGYYSHRLGTHSFVAIDVRGSHGKDDYTQPESGQLSGVPQWEYELRGRIGTSLPFWGGTLSPYTGIGGRWFIDEGKGYKTNTGALAYDRRIQQFYIPIGASLAYESGDGWTVTPQAEMDLMFYGNVDTRLTNLPYLTLRTATGYRNVTVEDPAENRQSFGLGLRSELMFGKAMEGYSLQAGPFVRYWYVPDSKKMTYVNSATGLPDPDATFYEPKNNRTQVGISARVLW